MDNYLRHEISSERIELIAPNNWKQHDTRSFEQENIRGFEGQDSYHRGTSTRKLCLSTLAISAALAIVCIALGTTVWKAETPDELEDFYNPGLMLA